MLVNVREIEELALYCKQPSHAVSLRISSLAIICPQHHEQGSGIVCLQLSIGMPAPEVQLTISYTWQRWGQFRVTSYNTSFFDRTQIPSRQMKAARSKVISKRKIVLLEDIVDLGR